VCDVIEDVAVINTEDLSDTQRSAVIDVCVAAHNNDEFRKMFIRYIPTGGRHFLAYRDGEVVSHAVVTTRWAQPGDHPPLRTAYVDAVSTAPAHQGKGYGSATMTRLAAEIDDYEIACLQTDRPRFYQPLGWEIWRGPLAGRNEQGLIPTPEQRGVMVLRLAHTPPVDVRMPLTIECQPDRIWE
jgi:aminoglycoside 2'-N-acetyltransferase I